MTNIWYFGSISGNRLMGYVSTLFLLTPWAGIFLKAPGEGRLLVFVCFLASFFEPAYCLEATAGVVLNAVSPV